MNDYKRIWPRVWVLAADALGIYLVSGHRGDDHEWVPGPWVARDAVRTGEMIHDVVREILQGRTDSHGRPALDLHRVLHQTSSHDGQWETVTYVAVLAASEFVRADWPTAKPVGEAIAEQLGRPATHGATESPLPNLRPWDVLVHVLRHLEFLRQTNATVAGQLVETGMARHLAGLSPVLASLYTIEHEEQDAAARQLAAGETRAA
jgi:hypothetical protein